jgi:hypothetical protein
VKNVSKAQDLAFLETFHDDWQLYLVPASDTKDGVPIWCGSHQEYSQVKTQECNHDQKFIEGDEFGYGSGHVLADGSHGTVFSYANKWSVSKEAVVAAAAGDTRLYTTNPDGSVDFEFVLYFKPQTSFYGALAIGVTTLALLLAGALYMVLTRKRNPKRKP